MSYDPWTLPGALPEWSGGQNGGYQAPDVGSQSTQLNFLQDMMKTGMDPFFAQLIGGGSFNPSQFDSTYETKPGESGGATYLSNILQQSDPNSAEYLIADYISNGGSPMEAVQLLQQKGIVPAPQYIDDPSAPGTGKKVPDPAASQALDYYTKFATDAYSKKLSDTPDEVTEIPSEFLSRLQEAGFSDPRQQYTAEALDPSLDTKRQGLYGTQYEDGSRTGGAHDQYMQRAMKARTTAGKGLTPEDLSALVQTPNAPFAMTATGGEEIRGSAMPPANATQGPLTMPGAASAMPTFDFQRTAPSTSRPQSQQAGVQRALGGQQAGAQAQALAALKPQFLQLQNQGRGYQYDRAKANAAAGGLARAGRSPFMDEMAARMAALQSRLG